MAQFDSAVRTHVRSSPFFRRVFVMLTFISLAACEEGTAFVGEDGGVDDLGATSQAIINGFSVANPATTPPVVAIYHQTLCTAEYISMGVCSSVGSYFWWPRPCSGTIIRFGSPNWILTARHCVTQAGTIDGPLLAASRVRIHTALSPGLAGPSGPPAGGYTAGAIFARTVPAGLEGDALWGRDIALVRVSATIPEYGRRVAIAMDPHENPSSIQWYAYGYGRSSLAAPQGPIEDGTSGAGTLRFGVGYTTEYVCLDAAVCGFGIARYQNLLSYQVWSGDSGGPMIFHRTSFPRIYGVHVGAFHNFSTGAGGGVEALVVQSLDWIQSQVGTLTIGTLDPDERLFISGPLPGSHQLRTTTLVPVPPMWSIDDLGRISMMYNGTRWYITRNLLGNGVQMSSVDRPARQRWNFVRSRIERPAPSSNCPNENVCLANTDPVQTACCATAGNAWTVYF